MKNEYRIYFKNLESKDKELQYEAYKNLLTVTEKKVDWAYEIWDQLKEDLTSKDNHKRSRAAQFLANLAISDQDNRILKDFPTLWEVTKDPKFVTARHSLQAIWKVGLAGDLQKDLVVSHLVNRFTNCKGEKNYTLIRFDIIQGLRNLYDCVHDATLKQKALDLIATENEDKYRKKYATVWSNT
ncbi:hypothetical protein [Bacillus sp. FJAT-45350]|uniref:hypothetical protein n=1 Tax=Bacillus sp. FJAT-45350 TaxID=2011014 RepID=UPI000BB94E27|nr:hypothetical protein [Bacillus sp. FJAT-45350]